MICEHTGFLGCIYCTINYANYLNRLEDHGKEIFIKYSNQNLKNTNYCRTCGNELFYGNCTNKYCYLLK